MQGKVAHGAAQGLALVQAQGLALHASPFAIAPIMFELIRRGRTDGDAGIAWLRAAIAAAVR